MIKIKRPAKGLTVIAASVHSLLRPTCNHNHKLLAPASEEIKRSGFWWYQHFTNFKVTWPPNGGEIQKSGSKKLYTRSHTIVITHQLWTPSQNSGGGRYRKVQFSELQKVSDLDLWSGQGHISVRNTYRTTSVPDHVTVVSNSTEIWPFEIRVISTFHEVWTHVIAFLKGNSKIGLWQAVE